MSLFWESGVPEQGHPTRAGPFPIEGITNKVVVEGGGTNNNNDETRFLHEELPSEWLKASMDLDASKKLKVSSDYPKRVFVVFRINRNGHHRDRETAKVWRDNWLSWFSGAIGGKDPPRRNELQVETVATSTGNPPPDGWEDILIEIFGDHQETRRRIAEGWDGLPADMKCDVHGHLAEPVTA